MSNQQKALYVLGLIIIAGIISIGSFSLGVYIGKQGWVFDQPSIMGPAQVSKPGIDNPINPPQDKDQNAPAKPDLVGIVISISSSTIELNTKQGVRLIKHTDQTVLLKQVSGRIKPIDLNAINSGDPIAVTGDFNPTSRTFTAEIVVLLEQK